MKSGQGGKHERSYLPRRGVQKGYGEDNPCGDRRGRDMGIPQSQIDDDLEVYNDGESSEGTLIITEWIAKQKGLI